ncbi:MAG: hypothetical protein U0228_36575 [Myxococcaceae bacterium]
MNVAALVMMAVLGTEGLPRVVVLDFTAAGVEDSVAKNLTTASVAEIARRGFFQPTSSEEVRVLLGLERQKQLMGCSENSCMAELAGALGAPFVLSGSVGKVGETLQLSLQLSDTARAVAVARVVRRARAVDDLLEAIPFAIAEVTGTPLPQTPSKALPATVLGVGGAVAAAGLVVGYLALNQEATLQTELGLADQGTANVRALAAYEQSAAQISAQKTVALALLVGGAAVAVTGAVLLALPAPGGARVALVPTGTGVAIGGTFP